MDLMDIARENEETIREEESYLKKILRGISALTFLELDIYYDVDLYLWLDKHSSSIRIKFNIDDSINNEFHIKKTSDFYIRGLRKLEGEYKDSLDVSTANKQELLEFSFYKKQFKIIREKFKLYDYNVYNFYMKKNMIIFYVKPS